MKKRLGEHERGEGANYTAKRLSIKLVYLEEVIEKAVFDFRMEFRHGRNMKKILEEKDLI